MMRNDVADVALAQDIDSAGPRFMADAIDGQRIPDAFVEGGCGSRGHCAKRSVNGDYGWTGTDCDPDQVKALIERRFQEFTSAMPRPGSFQSLFGAKAHAPINRRPN